MLSFLFELKELKPQREIDETSKCNAKMTCEDRTEIDSWCTSFNPGHGSLALGSAHIDP